MLTAKEIRESYKDFFRSKGHTIVPSAPMVIKDDPTLMFTNAGMNQFKDIILGNKAAKHTRVADSRTRAVGEGEACSFCEYDMYGNCCSHILYVGDSARKNSS